MIFMSVMIDLVVHRRRIGPGDGGCLLVLRCGSGLGFFTRAEGKRRQEPNGLNGPAGGTGRRGIAMRCRSNQHLEFVGT